jgi:hypothetical protein
MNKGRPYTGNAELLKKCSHLKHFHLEGKPKNLTIRAIQIEEFKSRDKNTEDREALVIYFDKVKLGLGLTANCNLDKVIELHGKTVKSWIGKRLCIFPTTCEAFGKTQDCIRIRAAKGANSPPPNEELPDDPSHPDFGDGASEPDPAAGEPPDDLPIDDNLPL